MSGPDLHSGSPGSLIPVIYGLPNPEPRGSSPEASASRDLNLGRGVAQDPAWETHMTLSRALLSLGGRRAQGAAAYLSRWHSRPQHLG